MFQCLQCSFSSSDHVSFQSHVHQCVVVGLQTKCDELESKIHKLNAQHHHEIVRLQESYEKAQQDIQTNYKNAIDYHKKVSKQEIGEAELVLFKTMYQNKHKQELQQLKETYEKKIKEMEEESIKQLQKIHGNCDIEKKQQWKRIQTLSEDLKKTHQTIQELALSKQTLTTDLEQTKQTLLHTQNHYEDKLKEMVLRVKSVTQQEDYYTKELHSRNEQIRSLQKQLTNEKENNEKEKEDYKKSVLRDAGEYKQKIQTQFDQMSSDNQKYITNLKRLTQENAELTEKNREFNKLRDTLTMTQNSLREYMEKCKELEKKNKTPSRKTIHFNKK